MGQQGFDPKDVTTPIQLIAALLAALFAFAALFLKGANDLATPWWAPNLLTVSAVAVVAVGSLAVFLLLTVFREQALSDAAYVQFEVLKRQFRGFRPERTQQEPPPQNEVAEPLEAEAEELESLRVQEYERTEGLLLSHNWRPSEVPGQRADITVRVHQHRSGPLSEGLVKSVEYELGRKFFPEPIVKTNVDEAFRLDISAYGPVLCIARVCFTDDRPPIDLFRYLDFPDEAIAEVAEAA